MWLQESRIHSGSELDDSKASHGSESMRDLMNCFLSVPFGELCFSLCHLMNDNFASSVLSFSLVNRTCQCKAMCLQIGSANDIKMR